MGKGCFFALSGWIVAGSLFLPGASGRQAENAEKPAPGNVFREQLSKTLDDGQATGTSSTFVVPEKKRLVIEYASFFANTKPGQRIDITLRAGPKNDHWIAASCIGVFGDLEQHRTAQPVKIHVDPGQAVNFYIIP